MDRGSHLKMLVLATTTQPTNEISAAIHCNYHCYKDTSFVSKTEATFNEFFGLKPQRLHLCAVPIY